MSVTRPTRWANPAYRAFMLNVLIGARKRALEVRKANPKPQKICVISGCARKAHARGWCRSHWERWRRHGDPTTQVQRPAGEGCPGSGYWEFTIKGRRVRRHVLIAEAIFGKALPPGAVVHHADGCPGNDSPNNLVICENSGYHNLLHQRMRAYWACGHAHWRKCQRCKCYDEPKNLYISRRGGAVYHRGCLKTAPVEGGK